MIYALMSTKINLIIKTLPTGMVATASWLLKQGMSKELQKQYRDGGWLEAIGDGAMIISGSAVDYVGAIAALQQQQGRNVHIGGKTALAYEGLTHYLNLSAHIVTLFGKRGEKLPAWFENHDWGHEFKYFTSSFLPHNMGIKQWDTGNFDVNISTPARAMMECLYLVPLAQDMDECMELMVGLNDLRPKEVQELLEDCTSVKVKRLFLYMAETCKHQWFQYLDLSKIDLGAGKRSIVKGGKFIKKYNITVS